MASRRRKRWLSGVIDSDPGQRIVIQRCNRGNASPNLLLDVAHVVLARVRVLCDEAERLLEAEDLRALVLLAKCQRLLEEARRLVEEAD